MFVLISPPKSSAKLWKWKFWSLFEWYLSHFWGSKDQAQCLGIWSEKNYTLVIIIVIKMSPIVLDYFITRSFQVQMIDQNPKGHFFSESDFKVPCCNFLIEWEICCHKNGWRHHKEDTLCIQSRRWHFSSFKTLTGRGKNYTNHCSLKSNFVKFEIPETLTTYSESSWHEHFEFEVGKGLASCSTFKKFQ